MRKPVSREVEDDMAEDLLRFAYHSLIDGARGSGVTLTKGECAILLDQLANLPPLRPTRWWGHIRVTSAELQYLFGIRGLSPIA
jgi:hypothetical protein